MRKKIKTMFADLPLSSAIITTGVICIIAAPAMNKYLQISYEAVPLHWVELSFGWGICLLGLLIRFIDQWDGNAKRSK